MAIIVRLRTDGEGTVKLVWHAENLKEQDWLRAVLGDLVDEEILDLKQQCFADDAIHVISSNWSPVADYERYFAECRQAARHLCLIHLSDEWFSGGYRLYRHFDAVVRNYRTLLADGDGILTIPLGYSNATVAGRDMPADQRRHAWSFVGELKASRLDMLGAMKGWQPGLLVPTASISDPGGRKLPKPEYDAILADTVFSPCPMGNVVLETWRLYESLELGCIPLVETRLGLDYFHDLLGPNPIPAFRNWHAARDHADRLYADKPQLLRKQQEIGRWWTGHKQAVGAALRAHLAGPSRSPELQRYSRLARNRLQALHEPLRLIELLRHQSAASLGRRLANPAGPLRRIASDLRRRPA